MRISLCNEVISLLSFPSQCDFAARLGYDGLEIAPFTLGEEPHRLAATTIRETRAALADHGLVCTSLHWLLVKPSGLSITSEDAAVRARTIDVMRRLIDLAAELQAPVLVHGSPAQRRLPDGAARRDARERGIEALAVAAEAAQRAGVRYCLEALAPPEANFVNTIAEAAEIVRRIDNPHFRTMLDCSAAGQGECQSLAELIDEWLPTGLLAHVQVNDRNRRGPGQGEDRFAPLFAALRRNRYAGDVAVEPFDYLPDGLACAARAIGYIRGILECQS